ncbi:MAG: bifunctional phosphopantothenoylcysteine decarboxylase/phosphopantothenate--cysteine ligase CoaBC [Candidatus Jordarchaeum sp.]|uniref:bifunctional phosphopantothenoylcysteine decarboxylase/phosphopantothenate--cysteine ligase CoaBC n=1 Tax=Candidatus Jordarchaeum sp. TaxID=2823881 RepID=UPI00404904A2
MLTKHTSKQIIGTKSEVLKGKKIVLCITGSVAAMECPIIARELMRDGAEVYAVMSPAATKLITPDLMEWATGNPVVTQLTGKVEHISLAGDHPDTASLVLVAPATANTISKIAYGIDDTPPTTVVSSAVGANIPIVIVPAMHESMFRHPIVLENINRLRSLGMEFVGPRFEEGKAKIAHIDTIVAYVLEVLTRPKDMKGLRVLITAGPTREYIDAVRYVSNPSSGKMGVSLAMSSIQRGAEVTLVFGPGTVEPPPLANVINVESTQDMLEAVVASLKKEHYDIMISTAAVSDYGPGTKIDAKTPSGKRDFMVRFVPLPKVINKARETAPDIFLVGFKAEYNIPKEQLISCALNKIKKANLDLIVANDISKENTGFASNSNEVYVIDKNGEMTHIPLSPKRVIASRILDIVVKKYNQKVLELQKTISNPNKS